MLPASRNGIRLVCNASRRLANRSLNYSVENRMGIGGAIFLGGLVGSPIIAHTYNLALNRNHDILNTIETVFPPILGCALILSVPEFIGSAMLIGFLAGKAKKQFDKKDELGNLTPRSLL